MSLNFTANPYFDDFDDTKNYHRILFKPGYAVQARELTQLQTQIQDQIAKFGKNIFTNGTVVTGCGQLFDNTLQSISLDSSYSAQSIDVNDFIGKNITGETSGAVAVVKAVQDATLSTPKTLLVSIKSGGPFQAEENILTDDSIGATIQAADPFNTGMTHSIDTGIFFVNGKFVYVEPQTIILDAYSNTSSYSIGLVLTEEFVGSDTDLSLLDNAAGTPNYAAPGADRYFASLTLSSQAIGDNTDGFTEIARVVDGVLVVKKVTTVYSTIGDSMASRTFDESGNYTVNPWPLHLINNTNGATGIVGASGFIAKLDPGKGYIQGYKFETIAPTYLPIKKARDTQQVNNVYISPLYGNYINVTNLTGPIITNPKASESVTPYTSVYLLNKVKGATGAIPGASGATIGSAKVRFLQYTSGASGPGASAVYKTYLFSINMNDGKYFEDVKSIGNSTASADIDVTSKLGVVNSGNTFLSDADVPGLVFPVPNTFVKTIRDKLGAPQTQYETQRTFTNKTFSGGTDVSIQTDDGTERFLTGSGELTSDSAKRLHYHVVITSLVNPGTTGYSVGDIINFDNIHARKITLGTQTEGEPHTATFHINDATFNGTCTIIAGISAVSQQEKTKALSKYKTKIIGTGTTGGLNTTIGGKEALNASDIYQIYGIYNTGVDDPSTVSVDEDTGVITWGSITGDDRLADYTLDDGQRAEIYDHGNLILTGTAPADNEYLLVIYKNFTHTGNGYLSVDSYTGAIGYENIPKFTDPSSGVTYNLRDCIDFRPRRDDNAATLKGGQVPDPSQQLESDYQYYLARIDTILATADQNLTVLSGNSAIYPKAPTNTTNGMPIYNLVLPPYTANIADVQVEYINNERFTMRDIGGLQKRIGRLEYYTQLSLLESQARGTSITDASTLEKFKNGFAVDSFTTSDIYGAAQSDWPKKTWGWWASWFNGVNTWSSAAENYNQNSIANASDANFSVAIDPYNQNARASFDVTYNNFTVGATGNINTATTGNLVTLSYTETPAINQPLASTYTNINPFNVVRYLGSVDLNPPFDQWVDTEVLPSVNEIVNIQVPDSDSLSERVVTGHYGGGHIWKAESSSSTIHTSVLNSTTTSLGTNVVSVQSVPYIRSSTIIVSATKLKPNTQHYAFCDSQKITSYIKPLTVLNITGHTGSLFDGSSGVYENLTIHSGTIGGPLVARARTAIYSAPLADGSRNLYIFGLTASVSAGMKVVGSNGGNGSINDVSLYTIGDGAGISDDFGNIAFEFDIPANVFTTGQRTITVIDNDTKNMATEESVATAYYTAVGLLQKEQTTLLTTRALQNQTVVTTKGYYYDPTAETFTVDATTSPQGFHVSSVELFFQSKDSNHVPVTVEIRETSNGYPKSVGTIPFASVTLNPEAISTSTDGSASTKFKFSSPIHLSPGEYAIVISSNSDAYNVFIAQTGSKVLGGTTMIDKQPYMGSLFKSQNSSTWTADQNSDLKFIINRASFATTGTVYFDVEDPTEAFNYQTLYTNISSIVPTGTTLTWAAKTYSGSAFDSQWIPIDVNQNINYTALKNIAAKSGIGAGTTSALRLQATLNTSSNQISPAIDRTSLAVVTAKNNINNDASGETASTGGTALAKYITKPINLASGFESVNLNVRVDINAPTGTSVKCYYRTLPVSSTAPMNDQAWVEMSLENVVAPSNKNYTYTEYSYFPAEAFDGNGVPQDLSGNPRFNAFQVKLVLLSENVALTPLLQNLRIIALDS
jgi:hypothetical protein